MWGMKMHHWLIGDGRPWTWWC